jgi:hypothetical protein
MDQNTLSLMCAMGWWGETRVFIDLLAIAVGIESIVAYFKIGAFWDILEPRTWQKKIQEYTPLY